MVEHYGLIVGQFEVFEWAIERGRGQYEGLAGDLVVGVVS
jgi:hypothetical protein